MIFIQIAMTFENARPGIIFVANLLPFSREIIFMRGSCEKRCFKVICDVICYSPLRTANFLILLVTWNKKYVAGCRVRQAMRQFFIFSQNCPATFPFQLLCIILFDAVQIFTFKVKRDEV